jgi:UDP-glucose 4-epimerase
MDWTAHHGDAFAGRRVLVTGGAGFIGSHLVEALVGLGADVVVIDNLINGTWDNLAGFGDAVQRITASIVDPEAVEQAMVGCVYVFHVAGVGSVPRSVADPQLYLESNAIGTYNIVQAARDSDVQRIVFSGSSNYYGDIGGEDAKVEAQPPMPLSPYAATKLFCEGMMRAWAYSYGVDTAVLRYFNIFGPRQNPNSEYSAAIAAFCKALLGGEAPTIYGDGEQSRDFTFVHNAVHANLLAASHAGSLGGEAFNAACGGRITVNELARTLAHITGRDDIAPVYADARPGEIRHSSADITRAANVLGYEPLVDLETGLAATVEWYRRHLQS